MKPVYQYIQNLSLKISGINETDLETNLEHNIKFNICCDYLFKFNNY